VLATVAIYPRNVFPEMKVIFGPTITRPVRERRSGMTASPVTRWN